MLCALPNEDGIFSNLSDLPHVHDQVMEMVERLFFCTDLFDNRQADLIISKQRNGPIGTVKMAFLRQYTKFENLLEGY